MGLKGRWRRRGWIYAWFQDGLDETIITGLWFQDVSSTVHIPGHIPGAFWARFLPGVAASLEEQIAEEKEDIICWKTWFQCPFFAVVDEEYY